MKIRGGSTDAKIPELSLHDLQKAEQLFQREKFKIKMDQQIKNKYDEIGMMCNRNGTKSISDFNYNKHMNRNMISVSVKDLDAKKKINPPKDMVMSNKNIKQLLMDYQNMPVIRSIDLNKKIDEKMLNQVIIDDELA